MTLPNAPRRQLLRSTLCAGAALGLAGCGFHMRAAPEFSFHSIYLGFAANSLLGNELRRNLRTLDKVELLDAKDQARADVIMDIQFEGRERVVLALNTAGQVRDLELRIRLRFKMRTPDGRELVPSTEILQLRDVTYNETVQLSKEAEEALLYKDMQSDIVQQLLRRLSKVRMS